MHIIPIPAFTDNYIWMLHDGSQALVVDPGDSAPVLACLNRLSLSLAGILVTHDDDDHIGGIDALRPYCQGPIIGPLDDPIPAPYTPVQHGDTVSVMGMAFSVIGVPGHTAGQVAYFHQPLVGDPVVLCGDALFSAGCGRWRVCSASVAYTSLCRLAALPDATRVCGAHEYTLANLAFARTIEPDHHDLLTYTEQCQTLRAQGLPTLPSSIALERRINPFLRCEHPHVVQAALAHGAVSSAPHDIFAALRLWKNTFTCPPIQPACSPPSVLPS
jgi:hydroxyacylglutathione hydrolase